MKLERERQWPGSWWPSQEFGLSPRPVGEAFNQGRDIVSSAFQKDLSAAEGMDRGNQLGSY